MLSGAEGGMTIVCDTREKSPLLFNHPEVKEVKKKSLVVGDYTAVLDDGYQVSVHFERKTIPDLFGSLSREYPRFKKEIIRAKENNITLVLIIEGSLLKVLAGFKRSEVSGVSILKTIFSIWVRYGVVPIFCKDRTEMANFIVHYFWAEERRKKENCGQIKN